MSNTDRNGDPLVSDILDIIDRDNSRYKVAVAVAAYIRRAEVAARKRITLHFRKIAQFQKDRGNGCERILGEATIMAKNNWDIDERYKDGK